MVTSVGERDGYVYQMYWYMEIHSFLMGTDTKNGNKYGEAVRCLLLCLNISHTKLEFILNLNQIK